MFLYEYATIKDTSCARERFMSVPLQCLNETLLRENVTTNYTCPPFSGPVSVVIHFRVLHFHIFHFFRPPFSGRAFSVHPAEI